MDVSSKQQKAQTSLYRACKNNQLARAAAALRNGASIELPDSTAGENRPLHIAAMFGAVHVIQLLAENGVDLDTLNKRGRTPLDVARRIGEKEAAALLEALAEGRRVHLEGSGDDDEDGDEEVHQAALFSACRYDAAGGASDAILGGADLEAVDGATANRPLHVAAIYGSVRVIELLHHFHVDFGSRNGEGLTAPELARRANHPLALSLLEAIADGSHAAALPAAHGGGPGAVQQGGGAALDGTVAFGEAPHPGVQPHGADALALNGLAEQPPVPQFVRMRGG